MRLADLLELPLIHLDQYFWKPGWAPLSLDRQLSALTTMRG
jgi:hypothetical protein